MHGALKTEIGLTELKKMVLQTLYSWRVMWHSSQALTFAEFLDLCASFSAYKLLYT